MAYAVLTACRALHTAETATVASKSGAAAWAAGQLPQWSDLIDSALNVRVLERFAGQIDRQLAAGFVDAAADRVAGPL